LIGQIVDMWNTPFLETQTQQQTNMNDVPDEHKMFVKCCWFAYPHDTPVGAKRENKHEGKWRNRKKEKERNYLIIFLCLCLFIFSFHDNNH